jgi:uncharacterized protein YdhG (YjbR/CyaY superfamily)
MAIKTVRDYIAASSPGTQPVLRKIRKTVRKAVPAAEERISYRIPAYFLDGIVVYFAAFKNHIGLFPPVRDAKLRKEASDYAGPKGNLKFPLDEPIPYGLIARIVKSRVKENREAAVVRKEKKRKR